MKSKHKTKVNRIMTKAGKINEDQNDLSLWYLVPGLGGGVAAAAAAGGGGSDTSVTPAVTFPNTTPVTTSAAPIAPPTTTFNQPATNVSTAIQPTNTTNYQQVTDYAFKGISMSVYSTVGYRTPVYTELLDNAKKVGFNTVQLSNIVLMDLDTYKIVDWQLLTTPFSTIGKAIENAQSHGLQVFLKPQIAAHDPLTGYIGNICNPDLTVANTKAFFATYKSYILEWAKLAEKYNVSLFSIGNEMNSVTRPEYTDYWYDIISSVRQVYHGKITYSALSNTDSDRWNEVANIKFWDKLDFIGVDVYPNMPGVTGSTTTTSVAEFNDGWKKVNYRDMLDKLANTYQKHIIFTETGVSSFTGSGGGGISDALIGEKSTQTDYQHQSNWYQSFFETWTGANKPSWFEGMFFWNNNPDDAKDLKSPWYKNNYIVYGKPAEDVISSFLIDHTPPAVTQTPAATTSVDIDELVAGFNPSQLAALLATYNDSGYMI